jgi:hypothetical protein
MSKSPEQKSNFNAKGGASSLSLLKEPSRLGIGQKKVARKTPVPNKYYLKSLHDEIDLYDRKLAHMEKYGHFASDEERANAIGKIATKRATLARTAQQLAKDGVEFDPSGLPRSFRRQRENEEHTGIA